MLFSLIFYSFIMCGLLVITYFLSHWKEDFFVKPLIVLCCAANIIYLFWRLVDTLPTNGVINQIAGTVLLATELGGLLQMLVFYTLVWKPARAQHIPLDVYEHTPTVDVMIATYNEPITVLKRTLAGCMAISYPKDCLQIYVCDDGDRQEVAELANMLGVNYVTREDHAYAKAGNLNHALQQSTGEFVAIFDADMVPLQGFLTRTIGHFHDTRVAFVQTPQAFYNDDPYQYNTFSSDILPNEQDFFMRTLQAGKARFNAVMFVGSNAVFRRCVLDEIGGFATGVITEDMATGMIIQAKGYKGLFVADVLAMGLAPETWGDMLKQRDRWCRGNIQCAKKWNPLLLHGLSPMQRILYMDGLLYWFFGIFKTIYILAPLLFLLLGIYSLQTNLIGVLTFWLPSFLGSYLSFRVVSKQKRSLIWSHIYDTSMGPRLAVSAVMELLFKKQLAFKVTPKGSQSGKRQFQLVTVLPHLIFGALTILALCKIGFDFFLFHDLDWQLIGVNLFWAVYNLLGLIVSIMIAVNQPRFRRAERFSIKRDAIVTSESGETFAAQIQDLNEFGARLQIMDDFVACLSEHMEIKIGNIPPVFGRRVWVNRNSATTFAMQFDELGTGQYLALIDYLFNQNDLRRSSIERAYASFFATCMRFIRRAFRLHTSYKRREVRRQINENVIVTLVPNTRIDRAVFEAAAALSDHEAKTFGRQVILVDLSAGGCQIKSPFPIELKAKVIVYSPRIGINGNILEAVWSQREKEGYATGLRFTKKEDNKALNQAGLVY